jgi:hypothetical protein
MGSTAPRKTNKKPTIRLVVELWRRPAVKRSKTPPDAKHKKKPAEKRSKTPPGEKLKKKLGAKRSKTPPGEKLKKKLAEKRSKTPPDAKLKKKLAENRSKTPPDEKHKKKLAEKHSKTLPGEKHKKNPSEEDQVKKTVDTGRPNSNHNPLPSSQEIHNTLSRVHRSATRAMEPFNALPVVLSGTQPV